MIALVSRAEEYLARHVTLPVAVPVVPPAPQLRQEIAALRRDLSHVAGRPMLLMTHQDDAALAYAQRADLPALAGLGPATPDHVIRTRRLPMIGRDVEAYAQALRSEFAAFSPRSATPLTMLDPAPRVVLDPAFGLGAVGISAAAARVVEDIARHTLAMIQRADALGGWRPQRAEDIFDVEYWSLEQAKLQSGAPPAEFSGEIALVTGAASGIGRACVEALLKRGAAVIGLDIQDTVVQVSSAAGYLGLQVDLTDEAALEAALERGARQFGGLDLLILNAGVFPASRTLPN